jgi:hypothetical protein
MQYPPGTIGILSTDLARWHWFHQSMLALEKPPGSQVVWCVGSWVSVAVNKLIMAMLPEHRFLAVFADDHIFEPDMLLRLLRHELPLVTPLCALRQLPYAPSLFHETLEGYKSYTWGELHQKRGLLPVDSFGGACCCIRREVIEAVGMPFFESLPGQHAAPMEDLYTFSKCRRAGYQPWVDLDIHIGHCIPAAVFPAQTETGHYGVRVWSYNDLGMLFPDQDEQYSPDYHAYT